MLGAERRVFIAAGGVSRPLFQHTGHCGGEPAGGWWEQQPPKPMGDPGFKPGVVDLVLQVQRSNLIHVCSGEITHLSLEWGGLLEIRRNWRHPVSCLFSSEKETAGKRRQQAEGRAVGWHQEHCHFSPFSLLYQFL